MAACQDVPTQAPGSAGAYPLSPHLAGPGGASDHDTYLANNAKNDNFGTELTLNLVTSAKNRLLVEFDDDAVSDAKKFLDATGGRVLLTLTIFENNGDWGLTGRKIEVHRMKEGWLEEGATWNCSDDPDTTNNQTDDCTLWDVSKFGTNPWEGDTTATAIITTDQIGDLHWDVTDDIKDWTLDANPVPNFGWAIMRTSEEEEGGVSFHSFEGVEASRPRLVGSVCPPLSTCGETLVAINGDETNPPFIVEVTGSPIIIAKLDVTNNSVVVLDPLTGETPDPFPAELIFSLEKLDGPCLGLKQSDLEVGPCWEGKATDPTNGEVFEIEFTGPTLFAACLPPESASLTRASDVVRMVYRKDFDPVSNSGDHTPSEAPLQVLDPASVNDILVDCEDFVENSARLDSNPLMRFARNLWESIREQVSPRPLHAARTALLRRANTRNNTSDIDGLGSAFSWAKLQVPYRDGGYTYVTVGRKCDDCDLDRAPRKWFESEFVATVATGWNINGLAAFGSSNDKNACALYESVDLTPSNNSEWPQADPKFKPPTRTELLLRKTFFVMDETGTHTEDNSIDLQVRVTGRNDFRAYLNGTEVTEFVTTPASVNLKKSKGWVQVEGGCPAYDEVIFTIPESLVLLGANNLLAIHARSRVDEPSFADVQVNVIEGN